MVGLDSAGKTTILYRLQVGRSAFPNDRIEPDVQTDWRGSFNNTQYANQSGPRDFEILADLYSP